MAPARDGNGELSEQSLVEPSRRAVVDVLDDGLAMAQLGAPQQGP